MDPKAYISHLVLKVPPAIKLRPAVGNSQQDRNLALDFTKGVLVLFMILYHWINYFVVNDGSIYRYLRFITPSFIFLTGFLVGNIYLPRYSIRDTRLHKRLVERGLKLIVLFTFLNIAATIVSSRNYTGSSLGLRQFAENFLPIYLIGDGRAAVFDVLVPIGYLLILTAPLLVAYRWFTGAFYLAFGVSFLGVFVLRHYGMIIPNLELISIGLLGMLAGNIPRQSLDKMVHYAPLFLAAYGVYLIAITLWNALYILQIAGVCLSLALIYLFGSKISGSGPLQTRLLLLGRYSLFAYVTQITLLQILVRVSPQIKWGPVIQMFLLFTTLACTQIAVELIDRGRNKSKALDHLYRLAFA